MNIGITGAGGFIGTRIIAMARGRGHTLVAFSRNPQKKIPGCGETRRFTLDEKPGIAGCDAIIHLAGEPVFGLWTGGKRRRIFESRVNGTRRIVEAILSAKEPPRVFVSGSAIGFYGDTGENETDEDFPAGCGFLAEVCREWEAEALRAREAKVRVVLLRTSVVLGPGGGAMKPMLPVFRAGLGGKLGTGRQWMSWIHLDDAAALALHAIEREELEGPLNAVAPAPCRNDEFTQLLAAAVHRPAFFRVPAFVLKTALGEFSHELLDSKRITSRRIAASGFTHRFPALEAALPDIAGFESR